MQKKIYIYIQPPLFVNSNNSKRNPKYQSVIISPPMLWLHKFRSLNIHRTSVLKNSRQFAVILKKKKGKKYSGFQDNYDTHTPKVQDK